MELSSIPATSVSAVFSATGTPIELRTIEIPPLQKGEILVRNEYTTLCKSDLHTYTGKRKEKSPTILGHETVGRIVAFGDVPPLHDQRGQALALNDRISWAIFSSHPNSALAQRGIPQKGDDLLKYGHEQLTNTHTLHGGLSQYVILRANTPIVKINEEVPLKIAAIVNCSVATVAGALRLAGDITGKNVLVSGAGMLGVVACAMSKTAGAATVIALDITPERLHLAQQFGADVVFEAQNNWQENFQTLVGGCDVILEMSGVANAMEQTLEILAIGGTAVWVGAVAPQRPLLIDAEQIVRKLHVIKGLHNYNLDDFVKAVHFIEQHHRTYPFAEVIQEGFCLHEIETAFEYALHSQVLRVGIDC